METDRSNRYTELTSAEGILKAAWGLAGDARGERMLAYQQKMFRRTNIPLAPSTPADGWSQRLVIATVLLIIFHGGSDRDRN